MDVEKLFYIKRFLNLPMPITDTVGWFLKINRSTDASGRFFSTEPMILTVEFFYRISVRKNSYGFLSSTFQWNMFELNILQTDMNVYICMFFYTNRFFPIFRIHWTHSSITNASTALCVSKPYMYMKSNIVRGWSGL